MSDNNTEVLKRSFVRRVLADEEIMGAINALDSGAGTYKEVQAIAGKVGDKLAAEVGTYSEMLFMAYAEAGHGVVMDCCEAAQANLNAAAGIGLKPKRMKFPEQKFLTAASRIGIAADKEAVMKAIAPTVMMAVVDDVIRYNADFQKDAGMKGIIVRTWSGSYPSHDTKHTDWCHDLAGTYEYGTEPPEVYARHDGCRCTVEYFPNKAAQGRITALAKGEVDVSGVLWNTKSETLAKRLAKQAKRDALGR